MKQKFMIAEGEWLLNKVVIFWCQYDIGHYRPDLFDYLGIYFPPSIRNSVKKRQAEFLAGRTMAARALSSYGIEGYQIGTGRHRAPVWPAGIIGSIAHTNEFAVSAALPYATVGGHLGLDIETPLSSSVAENICKLVIKEREEVLIAKLNLPFSLLLTLFFSAKESLFKAIYPSVNDYLDFDSSEVIDCNLDDNHLCLSVSDTIAHKLNNQKVFVCHFHTSLSQVLTLVSSQHA